MIDGLLLVNKPAGMTSHDVVQLVRRKLGVRRVGHTGTLDPMAQGLLVLLIGRATKEQQAFQSHEKVYEAVLRMGAQTDTADATGKPVRHAPVPLLDRRRIDEVLASFLGPFTHVPPAYSAVKVRGRPAYWWARRRHVVTLAARVAQLFELSCVACSSETITFRVRCSAGTYVRTLAEAIAERVGTVGHLTGLVRLRVGCWSVEEAVSASWLAQADAQMVTRAILPIRSAMERVPPLEPPHPA